MKAKILDTIFEHFYLVVICMVILFSYCCIKAGKRTMEKVGKEVVICGDTLMVVRALSGGDYVLSNNLKVYREIVEDNLIKED